VARRVHDGLKGQTESLPREFEQRKYKRLLMKDNVFAAVRGGFRKVGKIDDISIQGLGFSYLKQTEDAQDNDPDCQVDIFLPQNGFHLFNIPCKNVYEKAGTSFVEGFPVKLAKCGLHFGKLSDIQLNLLDLIIKKFTVKRKYKEKLPIASDKIFDRP
jgi:hypothetical protein